MKLYSYFRSSAAYRVRIALNFKGIAFENIPVHLVKDGGHNRRPEFRAVNPQMRVPVLVAPAGEVLIQSLAIIEYLDEAHPEPPLLPKDPIARAQGAGARGDHRLRHPSAQQCRAVALPQARDAPGANRDRRLVSSLGHRGLRGSGDAGDPGALCLRQRGDDRGPLSGAAGLQCAAAKGSARQVPKDPGYRGRLPRAYRPSTAHGRKISRTRSKPRPLHTLVTIASLDRATDDAGQPGPG